MSAAIYTLDETTALVGKQSDVVSSFDDTVYSLALENKIGSGALAGANPDVDPLLPGEGVVLRVPTRHILPVAERDGIVINLPEMRLYYFPPDKKTVHVYPIGIGRQGWETPVLSSAITSIVENPVWTPPESIHQEHLAAGLALPRRVGPGADNPLGRFALRIGHSSYLIHGTNQPAGVGLRVSHGCIRLYPEDIEALASLVSVGTKVRIINQPVKLTRAGGELYIQAHTPLVGSEQSHSNGLRQFIETAEKKLTATELSDVKRVLLRALDDGNLYTGLLMKVDS